MNNKLRARHAYIGGILDGEGSITLHRQRKGTQWILQVRVNMKDPQAVVMLHDLFPNSSLGKRKPQTDNCYPQYEVKFTANQAYDFLQAIKPYVIIKYEQVLIALAWLAHHRKNMMSRARFQKNSEAYHTRSEVLAEKLRAAKAPRDNWIETMRKHGMREYFSSREDFDDALTRFSSFVA